MLLRRSAVARTCLLLFLLLFLVGCSGGDNGGSAPQNVPATIEAALTYVVGQFTALTDGADRLVAAAQTDGSGPGVDLFDGGLFVSGTVAFDLDDDPSMNETDVPVTLSGSLPVDFTSGALVTLNGPTGSFGVPLAIASVDVTSNPSDGSLELSSDSGSFTSVNPPFEMILFNVELTVDGDRTSLTGSAGYETFSEGGDDFSFGEMTFRSTGSGFAIDVTETEGAYSFTVD